MEQFDVRRNPNSATARVRPYLLMVQSDLIGQLPTRVVVPLADAAEVSPIPHLRPAFVVEGRSVVMSTTEIAGVLVRDIGERVTSLQTSRDEIIAALDFLITGF